MMTKPNSQTEPEFSFSNFAVKDDDLPNFGIWKLEKINQLDLDHRAMMRNSRRRRDHIASLKENRCQIN